METCSQNPQSDHIGLVIDYRNADHRQQPTISEQTIKPTASAYQAATKNIRPQPAAPNIRCGQRAATKTTNIYRQQPTMDNQGERLQDESCADCLDAGGQQLPGSDGSSADFVLDVVKLGVLLKKYMQGHRKAMWWDQLWFRLVSVISLLCASATPIAEIFAEDASRSKIIVVLGAVNTLIVAFTTLMGFQTRMDKHHAACIEYTAMYDQFKVEYDICLQRENLPPEKRDQFKAFHRSCVSKCYDLASKTPPLGSSLRGELERSYETTVRLEKEKELALTRVKEGCKESENEMEKKMHTMYEELKTNIKQVCQEAAVANRNSSDSLMQKINEFGTQTQEWSDQMKNASQKVYSELHTQLEQISQNARHDLAETKRELSKYMDDSKGALTDMYNSLCGQMEQMSQSARDDLAETKHAMSEEMEQMIQRAHHDIADAKKVADQVSEDIAGLEHVLSFDLVAIVKEQQERLQRHSHNFEKAEEIMRSSRCSQSSARIFDYGPHQMREPRESNTPVARAGELRRKLSLSKAMDPDDQFHLRKSLSNSA